MRIATIISLALAVPTLAQKPSPPTPPPTAMEVSTGDRTPQITWFLPKGTPTAQFRVLRRRQYVGEKTPRSCVFHFRSRGDSLFALMFDTVPLPQGIQEYQLIPLDSTGTAGTPSAWVTVSTLDDERRPFITAVQASSDTLKRAIRLDWQVRAARRVRSIRVFRANTSDGPYLLIAELPPADTLFRDPAERVLEDYYYRLQVVDVFGPGALTVPVPAHSEYRPTCLPPTALKASADTSGVTLRWQPQGGDIKGFMVQRKELGDAEWRDVTGMLHGDTLVHWQDTSARAGLVYTWRVRALSTGDHFSEPSESIMATRPAAEGPPPPDGLVARRLEKGLVTVSWQRPLLSNAIIAGYRVERSTDGGKTFKLLNEQPVPDGETRFVDSTAVEASLLYRVCSIGPAGQVGKTGAQAGVDAEAELGVPSALIARVTKEGVQLSWPAGKRNLRALRIYRSDGGKDPVLLKELRPEEAGWLDRDPLKGTQFYVVRGVMADGHEVGSGLPVAVQQ